MTRSAHTAANIESAGGDLTPAVSSSEAKAGSPGSPLGAGTKPVDHYKLHMSPLRSRLRTTLLHYVRAETEPLARFQRAVRTNALDQYFALTANLGTHTFYMIMLPCTIWSGHITLAREMLWQLALGVYVTGVIKDYLCLPRPRSPPVHRISMSGLAVLEYGFPSTHSCNAASMALLFAQTGLGWKGQAVNIAMFLSIIIGRLYNGMHGAIDVAVGCILGVGIWLARLYVGPLIDASFTLSAPSLWPVAGLFAFVIAAVLSHPQPVDNCPCFDDSVAFLSVMLGLDLGATYHVLRGRELQAATAVYPGSYLPVRIAMRFVLGVAVIVAWRAVMKPVLLRTLPSVLRTLKSHGIDAPRRYFISASDYDKIPADISDPLLPESPREIAQVIRRVRKARGRSDSVGPQSAADVYEALSKQHEDGDSSDAGQRVPNSGMAFSRPRYDVEVTTKIIVYAGIPFLVVTFCFYLFSLLNI